MICSTDCKRRRRKRSALRRLGSISSGQARRVGWNKTSTPAQRHANRSSKGRMQSGAHDLFQGLQATASQTVRTASTWEHFFGSSAARGVEQNIDPSAAPRQPLVERTNAIRSSRFVPRIASDGVANGPHCVDLGAFLRVKRGAWGGTKHRPQRSATPTARRKDECNPELRICSTNCKRRRRKWSALRRRGSISSGQARSVGWNKTSTPAQRHANRSSKGRMQCGAHDLFHGLQATASQTVRTASTWEHFFGSKRSAWGGTKHRPPRSAARQPLVERTNAMRSS